VQVDRVDAIRSGGRGDCSIEPTSGRGHGGPKLAITTEITMEQIHVHTKTLGLASSLVLGLFALAGCPETPNTNDSSDDWNGTRLNGIAMNGIAMNGTGLDGHAFTGIDLESGALLPLGGHLDGISFGDLGVRESAFVAAMEVDDEMEEVAAAGLVGARLWFESSTTSPAGNVVLTEVVAAVLDVERLEGTAFAHHLSVYDAVSDAWFDPCRHNGGEGLILLQGEWDMKTGDYLGGDRVTFACRGDVLAKCVEWGYEPWLSEEHADLHQACTRMARADYCGDGVPMTVDGTSIDIYDTLGIQTQETRWPVEAEWGPEGATCIGGSSLRLSLLDLDKPDCFDELLLPRCGALEGESRLANRYK
jgi:hypothetical protein